MQIRQRTACKMLLICVKVKGLRFIQRHQQRNKIHRLAKDRSVIYRQLGVNVVTSIPVKLSKMKSMTTKATINPLTPPSKITRGLSSVMKKYRAIICQCNKDLLKFRSIKISKSKKKTMKTHSIIFKLKTRSSSTTSNKKMLRH